MISPIISTLRYKGTKAAIVWLCSVFGFEKHAVYESDEGLILNAQLVFGDSMTMLSDQRESEFDALQKTPADTDNICTQSCYIVIEDVEGHYHNTCDSGPEIVIELTAEDYAGAGYSCRDPEGHLWNFGSYKPLSPIEFEAAPSTVPDSPSDIAKVAADDEDAEIG